MRIRDLSLDLRARAPFLAVATAALALSFLALPAHATALTMPLTTRQMAERSERVLLVDVVDTQSHLDPIDGIVTDVVLRPVRPLKGSVGSELILRIPGGRIGDLELVVSEVPAFEPGERVAVFLDAQDRFVGGQEGKMRIVDGFVAATGEPLALLEARVSESPVSPQLRRALPEVFSATPESSFVLTAPAESTAIDEVTVLAVPSIVSVSPASAPAGIGAVVKITGSGFGTLGVNSRVDFRYEDPSRIGGATQFIAASGSMIESWSDTTIEVEVPAYTVDGYPASAGSGPMRVVNNAGEISATYTFTVPFSYGGSRWPENALEQSYRVCANTLDTTQESALVQAGATTWNGHTSFSLSYGGSLTAPPSNPNVRSYANEVWWEDMGNIGVLAQARYWYSGGTLLEADISFNDYYSWGDGSSSSFDIQTVATHEFGHWLTLRDLYGEGDRDRVMYGFCSNGAQKRTLDPGDVAGISWIYGSVDLIPPVTTISGVPDGWTQNDVTATLSASDDSGEPVTTLYRIGTGSIQTYTQPFTISAEGSTSVRYWSVDSSGNTETAKTATVRIDRTPPVTTITGPDSAYTSLTLGLSATDAHSGVAQTSYRIDGGEVRTGTSVTLSAEGTHSVEAWSVDAAGNTEDPPAFFEATVLPAPNITIDRISGADRYATALEISKATFAADSVDTVVIATGSQFADALSASGLAGAYGGPLLLTKPTSVSQAVLDEFARLGAGRVVIVGGTGAVSADVESRIRQAGYTVERINGATRYHTAAAVAERIATLEGSIDGVFIARGDDFADALAVAPYAYHRRMPILLVKPDTLPAPTASAITSLGVTDALIAGGSGAVSSGVESRIANLGVSVTRVSGSNRYATAGELVRHAVANTWTGPTVIGVTTGENFPDALGGGVAIGANGGAVVLTKSSYLSPQANAILSECTDGLERIRVFGGQGAVSNTVVDSIKAIWNLP